MIRCKFEVPKEDDIVNKLIESTIKSNENNYYFALSISSLAKIDFNQMDKRFKEYAENFMEAFVDFNFSDFESSFIQDSWCDLILNNVQFSNTFLFPKKEIQNISMKLQVKLLMNGMYFNLLPQILPSLNDVRFQFE
jgi:hypothetical protein